MQCKTKNLRIHTVLQRSLCLAALTGLLVGCGGGSDGAAVNSNSNSNSNNSSGSEGASGGGAQVQVSSQTIAFGNVPVLNYHSTASVTAAATSGLPVSFQSQTPTVCSVNASSGMLTSLTVGNCIVVANQAGDAGFSPASQVTQTVPVVFDPNQTIAFGAAPTLTLFSTATINATATSGLSVTYSSSTPTICTVDSGSGLVSALLTGNCVIAANQSGDSNYQAAPQVTQTLAVSIPIGLSVPGAPSAVAVKLGNVANTVEVSLGATASGGSTITSYTVTASPGGFSANAAASPIVVTCPMGCAGQSFTVRATNVIGAGVASVATDILTVFDVVERFYEPDTQPRDSIFIGFFTLNSTTGTVTNLRGRLSESMTGSLIAYPNDSMTWLSLDYQLSSVNVSSLGGLLVTTFRNNSTTTLSSNAAFGGTDGWSPGTGMGLYYGFPGVNPGNAYARIFVNTANPTATLSQAQIDKLAYADCAPGGMMAATCMTGTTAAGYGSVGTMSGYPVSQIITKR